MTIDEAIQGLGNLVPIFASAPNPVSVESIKLGTEALKRIKACRSKAVCNFNTLLPSETKK